MRGDQGRNFLPFCVSLQLKQSEVEISNGGHVYIFQMHFDVGYPLFHTRFIYLSRAPRPVLRLGNIYAPFPLNIWMIIFGFLFVLSILFLCVYKVYEKIDQPFIVHEPSPFNFVLFTFCKFTEPDPLPWFRSGVAGTFSMLLWSILAVFSVMFYLSNLRAVMVTIEYEKPIDTLQDVVDNNERVWINDAVVSHE